MKIKTKAIIALCVAAPLIVVIKLIQFISFIGGLYGAYLLCKNMGWV